MNDLAGEQRKVSELLDFLGVPYRLLDGEPMLDREGVKLFTARSVEHGVTPPEVLKKTLEYFADLDKKDPRPKPKGFTK